MLSRRWSELRNRRWQDSVKPYFHRVHAAIVEINLLRMNAKNREHSVEYLHRPFLREVSKRTKFLHQIIPLHPQTSKAIVALSFKTCPHGDQPRPFFIGKHHHGSLIARLNDRFRDAVHGHVQDDVTVIRNGLHAATVMHDSGEYLQIIVLLFGQEWV